MGSGIVGPDVRAEDCPIKGRGGCPLRPMHVRPEPEQQAGEEADWLSDGWAAHRGGTLREVGRRPPPRDLDGRSGAQNEGVLAEAGRSFAQRTEAGAAGRGAAGRNAVRRTDTRGEATRGRLSPEYYDEITGAKLDADLVNHAREEEVDDMRRLKVYVPATREEMKEAGCRPVPTRWIDQ